MSANIAKFFRYTPPKSLEAYFTLHPSAVSEAINWNEPPKNITKPLLKAADELSDDERATLDDNVERIIEMADEIGQTALQSVVSDNDLEDYHNLENEYDRALYVFRRDQEAFRRAEEIRYTDHYRKSRMWSGFLGPQEIEVSRNPIDLEDFKQKIAAHFGIGGQVKVEVFDRKKPYKDDQELRIIHVMVYREGLAESYIALEGDDLVPKSYRPVREMAVTYEPVSGHIEIIADNTKESREEIAKAFSEALLKIEIEGARVPLKQYEIGKLLKPFDFPSDPEDCIDSVKVTMLKLKPYDNSNKVTLEVTAKEARTIYDVSREWFDAHDPLCTGFLLAQVKFSIYFKPDDGNRRGKTLAVKIGWPNTCDLKDKTEKERLIGNKYLKRWGLLKEV
jgi:hypothetical protein